MNNSANRVVRLQDRLPSDVSGQITDSLGRIANQLTEVAQTWSTKAQTAAKTTDSYVRNSPWQAIGLVAIVSLAAGILASRRTQQSRLRRAAASDGRHVEG